MQLAVRMWTKLRKEIAACHLEEAPRELVSQFEMAALPRTVRRYMRFYGVEPGTPKHAAMNLRWTGEFRLAPDAPWMPIEAVQRDTRSPVARVFLARARIDGVVPTFVHDTYVDGRGRVVAKVADLFPIVDATGQKLARHELVMWVDEVVHFAPTMLLGRHTRWLNVDDHAFDVVFEDRGHVVAARVHVSEQGAPIAFETSDRRRTTPTRSWQRVGAQVLPTHGDASWLFEHGDFAYARLDLDTSSIAFER